MRRTFLSESSGGGYGEYRLMPIDNRKRDPVKALEPMLMLDPNADAGLLPERGNCAVPEVGNATSQIHH